MPGLDGATFASAAALFATITALACAAPARRAAAIDPAPCGPTEPITLVLMRPAITLGLGQAADAEAIAKLSRDVVEVGLGWIFTPARVRASLRDPSSNVLVARDAGRLIGAAVMSYGPSEAHLELLGLQPDARGLGLGRRMLEWLERPAIAGGLSVIWLEVRASNTAAQSFYRHLGYRPVAELPGYYEGREAGVRMGREIGRG